MFGLWFKNPVLIGLVFSFGWENLVGYLPGGLRYWTIGYYPRSLYIRWAEVEPDVFGYAPQVPQALPAEFLARTVGGIELPPIHLCALAMAGVTAAGYILAVALFRHREDA